MYKFRTEPWSKRLNKEREWTTCYTDVVNGYGHFIRGLLHVSKQPKEGTSRYHIKLHPHFKSYEEAEYKKPNTDHMWHVLHRTGPLNTNTGNSRSRLRWLLREGHRRRSKASVSKEAEEEITAGDTDSPEEDPPSEDINWSRRPVIPSLQPIREDEVQDEVTSPRDIEVKIPPGPDYSKLGMDPIRVSDDPFPSRTNKAWRKLYEPHFYLVTDPQYCDPGDQTTSRMSITSTRLSLDPINMPVAGLPTIWTTKPRHKTRIPPPYTVQPSPLPFSYSNGKSLQKVRQHRSLPRRLPSPPPTVRNHEEPAPLNATKPLPEIKREAGTNTSTKHLISLLDLTRERYKQRKALQDLSKNRKSQNDSNKPLKRNISLAKINL